MGGMGTQRGEPVPKMPLGRDVIVTVPMGQWISWLAEGDLPGEEPEYVSHFWVRRPLPLIEPGDRVYIVAHGRVRGYAPLVEVEHSCELRPSMGCLIRSEGAVAVTLRCQRTYARMTAYTNRNVPLPAEICEHRWQDCLAMGPHPAVVKGFRGWRPRWWERDQEIPFPDWKTDGLPVGLADQIVAREGL